MFAVLLQTKQLWSSNENLSCYFKACSFYRFSKVNCMELFLQFYEPFIMEKRDMRVLCMGLGKHVLWVFVICV